MPTLVLFQDPQNISGTLVMLSQDQALKVPVGFDYKIVPASVISPSAPYMLFVLEIAVAPPFEYRLFRAKNPYGMHLKRDAFNRLVPSNEVHIGADGATFVEKPDAPVASDLELIFDESPSTASAKPGFARSVLAANSVTQALEVWHETLKLNYYAQAHFNEMLDKRNMYYRTMQMSSPLAQPPQFLPTFTRGRSRSQSQSPVTPSAKQTQKQHGAAGSANTHKSDVQTTQNVLNATQQQGFQPVALPTAKTESAADSATGSGLSVVKLERHHSEIKVAGVELESQIAQLSESLQTKLKGCITPDSGHTLKDQILVDQNILRDLFAQIQQCVKNEPGIINHKNFSTHLHEIFSLILIDFNDIEQCIMYLKEEHDKATLGLFLSLLIEQIERMIAVSNKAGIASRLHANKLDDFIFENCPHSKLTFIHELFSACAKVLEQQLTDPIRPAVPTTSSRTSTAQRPKSKSKSPRAGSHKREEEDLDALMQEFGITATVTPTDTQEPAPNKKLVELKRSLTAKRYNEVLRALKQSTFTVFEYSDLLRVAISKACSDYPLIETLCKKAGVLITARDKDQKTVLDLWLESYDLKLDTSRPIFECILNAFEQGVNVELANRQHNSITIVSYIKHPTLPGFMVRLYSKVDFKTFAFYFSCLYNRIALPTPQPLLKTRQEILMCLMFTKDSKGDNLLLAFERDLDNLSAEHKNSGLALGSESSVLQIILFQYCALVQRISSEPKLLASTDYNEFLSNLFNYNPDVAKSSDPLTIALNLLASKSLDMHNATTKESIVTKLQTYAANRNLIAGSFYHTADNAPMFFDMIVPIQLIICRFVLHLYSTDKQKFVIFIENWQRYLDTSMKETATLVGIYFDFLGGATYKDYDDFVYLMGILQELRKSRDRVNTQKAARSNIQTTVYESLLFCCAVHKNILCGKLTFDDRTPLRENNKAKQAFEAVLISEFYRVSFEQLQSSNFLSMLLNNMFIINDDLSEHRVFLETVQRIINAKQPDGFRLLLNTPSLDADQSPLQRLTEPQVHALQAIGIVDKPTIPRGVKSVPA